MKSILAFGDSLTWGFVAGTWERHKYEDRWPNALAAGLKGKARVIEEGMNGRTTVFPDPTVGEERNGAVGLPIALTTHQPLDLVIIMLGTNDIKYANRCRAFDASMGMARLIEIVQRFPWIKTASPPQVLIMSPPTLCKTNDEWFNDLWGHAIEESKLFAKHYKRVAEEMGVHFFDAGRVAVTDPTDGGHLDAKNTRAIGEALVPVVKGILG
ncbi:MAG: SGNH/GDSL hydrolase family protein, partial [Aestuariivirga sp.]